MVAAIIPAAIVGIILLVIGGRVLTGTSALFPSRDEQRRRNDKGAAGNTVDFVAGEGTARQLENEINQKGVVGTVTDKLYGQGAAASAQRAGASVGSFLDDQYTSFQVATHNAITDPFNLRGIPDLTLSQVRALEARGVDVGRHTAQELHDLVLGGALDAGPSSQSPVSQQSGGVMPTVIVSPQPTRGVQGGMF